MRLRNRNTHSFVAWGSQRDAPRRLKPRITQYLYLAVLFAILGYIVFYIANYWLTFDARGQIVTGTSTMAATRDGRVEELTVSVGERFLEGEAVARIKPPSICEPVAKRAEAITDEIDLNRQRITGINERIRLKRRTLEELSVSRALELDGSDDARPERRLRQAIAELEAERANLREDNRLLRERRARLEPDPRCQSETVTAPFAGRVIGRHRKRDEVVKSGDPILTVQAEDAEPLVVAYLEPEDMASVSAGDLVDVVLPNGVTDTGRIRRTRSSAEDLPGTLWDGYRRKASHLAIEVEPVLSAAKRRWREFHLMEVSVEGRRQ